MSKEAIGGYFELEIQDGEEYHSNAIRLNTGRHALEYILRAKEYKKIYLPYYTCEVIFEPVRRLNVEIEFYSIDENFMPIFDFNKVGDEEVFLYTNYFGICANQIEEVISKSRNTIIDNAQSFFSKPVDGVDTFYSARKFFGVPDGAYLYTDKELGKSFEYENSINRFEHLITRIEKGAEAGYKNFKANDASFNNSLIKKMSKISQRILKGIDYDFVTKRRLKNFNFLHEKLSSRNELKINLELNEVPMVYPFLNYSDGIREYLIEHKIFVPTYWPNVLKQAPKDSLEFYFAKNILFLPIDQRFTKKEMQYIINKLMSYE